VYNLRRADSKITHNPNEVKQILFDLPHSDMSKLVPDDSKFDKDHFNSLSDIVAAISNTEKGSENYDKMFTKAEVEAAIAEAQNHKATRSDLVPNEILKYGGQSIISALHTLLKFTCITPASLPQFGQTR
jgi:hypothetical protein